MKKAIVKIENLNTIFKNKKENKIVHSNLSLNIYDSEILSIIGANGAGKTVLVETIAGVRGIQSGTIKTEIKDFTFDYDIGIQFQTEDNTSSILTAKNMLAFYKKFYKGKFNEEELNSMIEIFGVKEFLDRKIKKLSGGQKQRLNLLLAIMHKPKLLILDEFTTGLDITSVIDILDYIKKFAKENKSTVIIVTHNAKEIKMLADRVALIQNGRVANEITTSEVNKKYNGDFDQFLIDQIRGVNNE